MTQIRIYLSPPHLDGDEHSLVADAIASNWVAPLGPHVDAFEREFAAAVSAPHAVALSSGTAALHIALVLLGIGPKDEVIVSSLTFAASANAVRYVGARPVFVDSEARSWNLDPALVAEAIAWRKRVTGRAPAALIAVDIYGQTADYGRLIEICRRESVAIIEDAAEALGATHGERPAGMLGDLGVFSFNGNKIITTSGGGMLVTERSELAARARHLSTQARMPAPHYEHEEIGFNYRLSNVLAALGRGQLRRLAARVEARRSINATYRARLGDLPGVEFMPEAPWGRSNGWLTCLTIDPQVAGTDRERVRAMLLARGIEARPVWKPMHLQPVFRDAPAVGGAVSERLFTQGLCLPSGSSLAATDLDEICDTVRSAFPYGAPTDVEQPA